MTDECKVQFNGRQVPYFSQVDYKDVRMNYCFVGPRTGGITTDTYKGCAVVCAAMVLNFYGKNNVNPELLDKYLDSHSGYDGNDNLAWDKAFSYKAELLPKLKVSGIYQSSKTGWVAELGEKINSRIDGDLPTIVYLKEGHFVVVVGRTSDGDFLIHDPGTAYGSGLTGSGHIIQKKDLVAVKSHHSQIAKIILHVVV